MKEIQQLLEPLANELSKVLDIPVDSIDSYTEEYKEEDKDYLYLVLDYYNFSCTKGLQSATWSGLSLLAGDTTLLAVNVAYNRKEGAIVVNCSTLVRKKMRMSYGLDFEEIRQACLAYVKAHIIPNMEN